MSFLFLSSDPPVGSCSVVGFSIAGHRSRRPSLDREMVGTAPSGIHPIHAASQKGAETTQNRRE